MENDEIYQQVMADYKITGSVKKTAQNVGTTLVRAQRILITEGLWSSPTSKKVGALYSHGKTVPEIAAELCVSEKTVQAYLPYIRTNRGYGGVERSADALKSDDYRKRMQRAAEKQVSKNDMKKEMKEIEEKESFEWVVISKEEISVAREEYDKKFADESKKVNVSAFTTEELYGSHMRKRPEVLKLELALDMDGLRSEDMDILKRYSKVEKGITREILIPADMTLHALNYVIFRAFGWQNSHLHHFRLPKEVFQKLTGGKNNVNEHDYVEYDGLYTDWMKLCGLYFRFPCDDFDDLYWDDDYEEGQSIKTWFRKKYTGPYKYKGRWEHYHFVNDTVKSVVEENPTIRRQISFAEWSGLKDEGKKPEKMLAKMIPIEEATIQELSYGFEGRMDELLERIPLIELMIPEGIKQDEEITEKIAFLQKRQEKEEKDLPVLPVSDELIYAYDYGDGWEVKIRLKECYYTIDEMEAARDSKLHGFITVNPSIESSLSDQTAFDRNNQRVNKSLALKIATVNYKKKPICLELDGMPLMDDVGGIHGYVDFLRTIHGEDPDEKEDMKEWAKWMGWTGRMPKPESLL